MSEGPEHAPQRVIGRYALYGEIAAGGMATVHAGRLLGPVGFSRTVAIKRLHPQYAKDPEFVSMFLDEARVAARIQHPNVVSTLDVVALEGELFLVMEYVEGESLGRVLRTLRTEGRLMPPRIVGSIMCNVLYGLHAAHEAVSERGEPLGIVHRDVSPQNVLVGIDGAARVLDFGVAKAAGRIQTTREGQVKGKIAYMPPEQLSGGAIDRRLDVYAAAVVLWEVITSRRLFDGDNDGAVLQQVLTGVVTPPSHLVPNVPVRVDEIIMKGLSRNPAHRYATAHDMAVELEEAMGVESPRKVSDFVQQCAGESIAKRAARIKEIEQSSTDPNRDIAAVSASESSRSSQSALAPVAGLPLSRGFPETEPLTHLSSVAAPTTTPRGRGLLLALVILSAMGLAATVAVLIVKHTGPSSATASSPDGSATARSTAKEATSTANMAPSASPPPVTTTTAMASATASASASASAKVGNAIAPNRGTAPQPKPRGVSCNPPFVIVDGIRKIKPECLD